MVGNAFAVGGDAVGSVLDVARLTDGDAIHVDDVAAQMGQFGFLAKQIAATGHAMLQGNRPHLHTPVFAHELVTRGIHLMHLQRIVDAVSGEFEHGLHHLPQVFGAIEMERSRTPQHTERGNHPRKTITVVAMQMGDEDTGNLGEMDMGTAQLHLCAFTAVYHAALVMNLHNLRGGMMTQGGQSTATPEDMDIEIHG